MTLSPADAPVQPRYSWAEIWTAVLTRPSVQTFQEILRDPAVSKRRAYTWMIIAWAVNVIFIAILTTRDTTQLMASMPSDMRITPSELQSAMLMSMVCILPFALLIGLVIFRVMVWLVQAVAAQLGGDVNYDSGLYSEKTKNSDAKANVNTLVTYSFAAVQAPLNIVSLLFAALPANVITSIISLIATCYQFYLMSLSLRAIYGFSIGRALAAVFVTFIIFFAITFGIMYLLLSLT